MQKKIYFIESNTTGTGMIAINKAREYNCEPILLTNNINLYKELDDEGCSVIEIDTNCLDVLNTYLSKENRDEIAGIMTTSDFYLETAASLAETYSLYSNSRNTISICRNKALLRDKLASTNIKQPKYWVILSLSDLEQIQHTVSLPCVIKPANDSGSNNVRLCMSWKEVEESATAIFNQSYNARGQKTISTVLLEEYIEGPEYSVETFTFEGNTIVVGITEKRIIGFPYFVEGGHIFPANISQKVKSEIESTVLRVLKKVNYKYGAAHTEVKWTSKGCILIEINPRLAGGMIPELIRYTTEVDLISKQVACSIGINPKIDNITNTGYSGIHFW